MPSHISYLGSSGAGARQGSGQSWDQAQVSARVRARGSARVSARGRARVRVRVRVGVRQISHMFETNSEAVVSMITAWSATPCDGTQVCDLLLLHLQHLTA